MARGRSSYRTPSSKRVSKKVKYNRSSSSGSGYRSLVNALNNVTPEGLASVVAPGIPPKLFLGKPNPKVAFARKAARRSALKSGGGKARGYSGRGQLGGKIGRGKRYSRKVKVNGKYTQYGIEKLGITLATEHRTEVSKPECEGLMIGHTSLPGKFAFQNMWRAIFKYLFKKMECNPRDWGNVVSTYSILEGDVFSFTYFNDANTISVSAHSFTVPAASCTFDQIVADFVDFFTGLNFFDKRIGNLLFLPKNNISLITPPFQNVGRYGMVVLPLNLAKVAVCTKSTLKIQNVTVENNADNEEDDVTRVPLQGMSYTCKGNNVVRKADNEMLPGLYDPSNEHTLYKGWTKAFAALNKTVGYYVPEDVGGVLFASKESTFYKTSEMPKPWEIQNCSKSQKFYMAPGDIRTSVVSSKFEMTLQAYWRLLTTYAANVDYAIQYNDKQGYTKALYLEKVIGKKSTEINNVKLWTETEFRQSTLIFDGELTRTLPITYQENKDTVIS